MLNGYVIHVRATVVVAYLEPGYVRFPDKSNTLAVPPTGDGTLCVETTGYLKPRHRLCRTFGCLEQQLPQK